MNTKLSFTVQEAYTRDVGRGVARIDYDSMDALNATSGDIIEIKGEGITVAKCLPLFPSDEGKGIIRIDGLGRNNSGIAMGDTTTVRKIKAVAAEKVIVTPLEAIPPIDEQYLADALESIPVIKGDNVMVPYFGGRLTFQIVQIIPEADAVLITNKTIFAIESNPWISIESHMNNGMLTEAIDEIDAVLKVEPHNSKALHYKGKALLWLDKFEDAIFNFNKAFELEPYETQILLHIGMIFFEYGKFNDSLIYYNKFLENEPNNIDALINRGKILMILNKYEEAKQCFEKILVTEPTNQRVQSFLTCNF